MRKVWRQSRSKVHKKKRRGIDTFSLRIIRNARRKRRDLYEEEAERSWGFFISGLGTNTVSRWGEGAGDWLESRFRFKVWSAGAWPGSLSPQISGSKLHKQVQEPAWVYIFGRPRMLNFSQCLQSVWEEESTFAATVVKMSWLLKKAPTSPVWPHIVSSPRERGPPQCKLSAFDPDRGSIDPHSDQERVNHHRCGYSTSVVRVFGKEPVANALLSSLSLMCLLEGI